MSLRTCRKIAALLALLVCLCGAAVAFLPLPVLAREGLGLLSILLAVATVVVVVRFHRCPKCGKFVPFTGGYRTCIYCEAPQGIGKHPAARRNPPEEENLEGK